jgi:hypothetical protein
MLTPQDDLICHQTPRPFTTVGGGDERFTERYWYTAHPIDGTALLFDAGLGYYPNKGVMDAFAGITIGRRQINFRASRHLGAQPLETAVGPLRFEVLEGMKRHRLTLDENDSGISFELEFEASFPAAQEKQSFREHGGMVEEDLLRMAQFGRWRGWIIADGKRYNVNPELWWGQRDHSWGIRSAMNTDEAKPPAAVHKNLFWTWSMFQFENTAVSIFLKERSPEKQMYLSGTEFQRDADGKIHERHVTGTTHEIDWAEDPLGQSIAIANFHITFEQGPPRNIRMECLPTRFYLKGGMYGGFNGWNHGDDMGAYHSAHDVWDLDDAATRAAARTLSDHVVRVTSDGMTGAGISEYGVATGYPRYLAPQRFHAL